MRRSGFRSDFVPPLIGDASFWINLLATQLTEAIVRAIGPSFAITDIAFAELVRGRDRGRSTAAEVERLVTYGLIEIAPLSKEDESDFLSLVAGPAPQTLDDGEAATLVVAAKCAGTAVIDERKATALAAVRYPKLALCATADLLLAQRTRDALGDDQVSRAIFNALRDAKMSVPEDRVEEVLSLLGPQRATVCSSIPERYRSKHKLQGA